VSYSPQAAGAQCDTCPLKGKKFVPPVGPADPDLFICGEAPGAHEEKRRTPFVGPSGMLFDQISRSIGIDRKRLWITNAILCRPDTPGVAGTKRFDVKTYLAHLKVLDRQAKKLAIANQTPYVPIRNPFDCCRPRLMAEVSWFSSVARARGDKHAAIGAMGNFASQALTGKKVGIMKLRGSSFPVNFGEGKP
jgi:uracil-DNA glycosylase